MVCIQMKYLALLFLIPAMAFASGVDNLKNFLHNSRTVKSQFTQTVLDRNGKQIQAANGTMQFSRPGKLVKMKLVDYHPENNSPIFSSGKKSVGLWPVGKAVNTIASAVKNG